MLPKSKQDFKEILIIAVLFLLLLKGLREFARYRERQATRMDEVLTR